MVEVVNLKTCKDWGKPGDVKIDRTTPWGNPFLMYSERDRDHVCDLYESWFIYSLGKDKIKLLKDAKRLGCWCAPKRCHGDFLKKLIEELV